MSLFKKYVRMEHDCKENSMQSTTFLKRIRKIIDGDSAITISIIALMAFGTLMVLSTEVGETSTTAMVMLYNVFKQIIYWILSFALIWLGSKLFTFRRFSFFISQLALRWLLRWSYPLPLRRVEEVMHGFVYPLVLPFNRLNF